MIERLPQETALQPVHQLCRELRAGNITALQLTELYLERIARLDGKLHAFVTVFTDAALAAAAHADKRRQAGDSLGPLHGIPVACKDIIEYQDRQTTWGCKALEGRISEETATVIARLESAGAIVLGKTHTVEFALGGWGTNEHCGTPWNPWDLLVHRTPGGSSSGSGVASTAGLAAVTLGTDTGGSVRLPASFCGLAGLKPTFGRVSNAGVMPLSTTLDTVGPLARCIEDAALVYNCLQGPDPLHPQTQLQPPEDPLPTLRDGVAGLRLAALPASERETVSAPVLAAYDESLQVLQSLGAEIVQLDLPRSFAEYREASGTIISAEGYSNTWELIDREELPLDRHVRERMLPGKAISAKDYLLALRTLGQWRAEFEMTLRGYDALLTPTSTTTAIPVAEVDETVVPAYFTRATNVLGWCALALPNGYDDAGLPTSLCIQGHPFDEARVLRIGWALEQATAGERRAPEGII
ncbi:MAG: amidase [Gammaproteobacteria bacterium]|nr:amidase [Gammaproteobacteria bacterium]